jgi:hypothetical protein
LIVAGELDISGSGPHLPSGPKGIVVSKTTGTFYVAELSNHRGQVMIVQALVTNH